MTHPSRVAAIGVSSREIIEALGIQDALVEVSPVGKSRSTASGLATAVDQNAPSGCPLAPFVAGHTSDSIDIEWANLIKAARLEAVVADVACDRCLGGAHLRVHPGQPVAIAIGRPPLSACLDLLTEVGGALEVPDRAATAFKWRSARLLALRMHVARYLVRTPGSRRPTTLALVRNGDAWRVRDDFRCAELIDAVGGERSSMSPGATVTEDEIARLGVSVILAGADYTGTSEETISRQVNSLGRFSPTVWHVDWRALLDSSGPSVVDAVEALLRAVLPEALGTNGTPPSPTVLRRVASGGNRDN